MNDLSAGLPTTSRSGCVPASDLRAARARLARIQGLFRPRLAEHGLGQLQGEGPLADAGRPGEQEAAGQPPAPKRPAELLDHVVVSVDAVPGHGGRGLGIRD